MFTLWCQSFQLNVEPTIDPMYMLLSVPRTNVSTRPGDTDAAPAPGCRLTPGLPRLTQPVSLPESHVRWKSAVVEPDVPTMNRSSRPAPYDVTAGSGLNCQPAGGFPQSSSHAGPAGVEQPGLVASK